MLSIKSIGCEHVSAFVVFLLPTYGLFFGMSYAPLAFGLAGFLTLHGFFKGRSPRPDRVLTVFAGLFLLLSWASLLWTVAPKHSFSACLQLTGIMLGAVLLASQRLDDGAALVLRVAAIGLIVGPAVVAIDLALGSPLITFLYSRGKHAAGAVSFDFHYNRGLCYMILIASPVFYWLHCQKNWRMMALVAVPMLAALLLGASLTARLELGVGVAMFVLSRFAPRVAVAVLIAGLSVLVLSLPWLILEGMAFAKPWMAHVKESGVHRLEIWYHMATNIMAHPLLGSGLAAASHLPVTPEEVAAFKYPVDNIYPHNQLIQLWVELGGAGAVLGLVFVGLGLVMAARRAPAVRPFMLATMASAVMISMAGFQIFTDSWWAVLAMTAFLFTLAERAASDLTASEPASAGA